MIVRDRISLDDLAMLAEERFGDLVKAVVDIDRQIMSIGADLHADEEKDLICRAREVVCDFIAGDNEYGSTADSLDRYFLPFAVAARRERGFA